VLCVTVRGCVAVWLCDCVWLCGCVAAEGSGGGLALLLPQDDQPVNPWDLYDHNCVFPPAYWPYAHGVDVFLMDVTLTDNTANCTLCSGGGLHMQSGGALSLSNVSVSACSASKFGGGVSLGSLGVPTTCSVEFQGCVVGNNSAGHGGAQLYNLCAGDAQVDNTAFLLDNNGTQVRGWVCGCMGVWVCGV
jgi:hypothetical protein